MLSGLVVTTDTTHQTEVVVRWLNINLLIQRKLLEILAKMYMFGGHFEFCVCCEFDKSLGREYEVR